MSAQDFYPFQPTGLIAELDLDGDGVYEADITPWLRGEPGGVWVAPDRGQQGEGAAAPPAQVAIRLDNADRRFSPRAPQGAYYGLIGRNTAARLSLPATTSRLPVPVGVYAPLATASSTITSSVSDLDVRVWLETSVWRGGTSTPSLIHQWVTAGNHRRWALFLQPTGQLLAFISSDGITRVEVTSTELVPQESLRQALRVSVDWNNGAGGSDWKFWTAPDLAGPWVQLGATVVGPVLTPAPSNDAPIVLGAIPTALPWRSQVAFLGAQVYNGRAEAGGTLLVNLDLTNRTHGATTIVDATGFTWNAAAGVSIDRRDHLITGTVPDWQTVPGVTADDCEVTAVITDDLRRIGAIDSPNWSAYRRAATAAVSPLASLVGYWPFEESVGATTLSSAVVGQAPARIVGAPTLSSDDTSFPGSDALPVLTAGAGIVVPIAGAPSGTAQWQLLFRAPPAGFASAQTVMRATCSGSAQRWDLVITTGGLLRLTVYEADGSVAFNSADYAMSVDGTGVNGRAIRVRVAATQSGANIAITFSVYEIAQANGVFVGLTVTGQTLGAIRTVDVATTRGMVDATVGHLSVQGAVTDIFELFSQLNAYVGETGPVRVTRLCTEAGIPISVTGVGGPRLGAQRSAPLVELLREAEQGDGGILHSAPGSPGLAYRSLTSMYSQVPVLTAAWDELGIVPGVTPVDDDRYAANDVTLSRPSGESFHAVQETGPANVQAPPLGIGRYEVGNTTVSAYDVEALAHRTGWELHLGTVDEPRLTNLTIDLGSLPYVAGTPASLALSDAVRRVDVGDRILITDMPSWWGATEADLLVIGVKPEVGPWLHRRTFVVRPARAFHVARYNTSRDRYSVVGTVTAESLSNIETDIDITPPPGFAWGHGSGDYDIVIGGEVMTVTAVSALSGGTQTMTVVRSVNGINKPHVTGLEVALYDPCYYAPAP